MQDVAGAVYKVDTLARSCSGFFDLAIAGMEVEYNLHRYYGSVSLADPNRDAAAVAES